MGEEWPLPATGVFQRTFFEGPHSSGRFFSAEMPLPSGPRHPGQFASPAAEAGEGELEKETATRRAAARDSLKRPDSFTCCSLRRRRFFSC
jgi:hypothetical protein